MQTCLKLAESYQEQYEITKEKLAATPKGKQFDFPEKKIFGDMELFCRRIGKLINLFSTIDQFSSMSASKLEGMTTLIQRFKIIVDDFQIKKHDLLDTKNQEFDRDFVEFNIKIEGLEAALQHFINQSFENITTIESSLILLGKFQACFQREALRADLDSKLNIIFQNYGTEFEEVQQLYEQQKHEPPLL
jgi:dynein heavy chain